jgi:hypothetical protein
MFSNPAGFNNLTFFTEKPKPMAKITLHGMFARVMGKFNRSEVLYFKRCQCGKEQLGVDLLNPSKAKGTKNVACQNALKTAAQAAKTALADPEQRAALEAAFASQSKYSSLFAYTVAQKYVRPSFEG